MPCSHIGAVQEVVADPAERRHAEMHVVKKGLKHLAGLTWDGAGEAGDAGGTGGAGSAGGAAWCMADGLRLCAFLEVIFNQAVQSGQCKSNGRSRNVHNRVGERKLKKGHGAGFDRCTAGLIIGQGCGGLDKRQPPPTNIVSGLNQTYTENVHDKVRLEGRR